MKPQRARDAPFPSEATAPGRGASYAAQTVAGTTIYDLTGATTRT
jgi:hypothetical protein